MYWPDPTEFSWSLDPREWQWGGIVGFGQKAKEWFATPSVEEMPYGEAKHQAREQMRYGYERQLEGTMATMGRQARSRGFYGQAPADAMMMSTAGDMAMQYESNVSNYAGQLQQQHWDREMERTMMEQQSKQSTMRGLGELVGVLAPIIGTAVGGPAGAAVGAAVGGAVSGMSGGDSHQQSMPHHQSPRPTSGPGYTPPHQQSMPHHQSPRPTSGPGYTPSSTYNPIEQYYKLRHYGGSSTPI